MIIKKISELDACVDLAVDDLVPVVDSSEGLTKHCTVQHILNKVPAVDLSSKQDTLISTTNIKTINSQSILGSGDLVITSAISSTQTTEFAVKNEYGSTINKGQVLIATGTNGNSGNIVVGLGKADGSVLPRFFVGVASANINNGDFGTAVNFGKISGIQTNGVNYSETWVDGDVLYISDSVNGGFTKVEPIAPHLKLPVAFVIHAHGSNGVLMIRMTQGTKLDDVHNVYINNPQNGQTLKYNSSTQRWENSF